MVLILIICYLFNLVLHLVIAELSYNNDGAQFIKCFDRELFSGRFKTLFTWAAPALLCLSSFVGFSRFASLIQVVTGVGIIWAYHLSRRRVGEAKIIGRFGSAVFQIVVVLCTLLATVGAVLPVS